MALGDWSSFFSAEVGASASLVGLVTVAISINLKRILEIPHLPARAGEALSSLTTVFVTCGVALFPGIPLPAFGAVALALAVASLGFGARNQGIALSASSVVAIEKQIVGGIGRVASTAPIAVGGALMLANAAGGVTWVAVGVVISLAVSVMNAWVLLVEIMR